MSAHPLVRSLLRRWPSIVAVTVIGVGLAALALNLATERFTSHADVLVSPPASQSTEAVSSRTVSSYAQVLDGRAIADRVAKNIGGAEEAATVDRQLAAEVLPRTSIIRVSAENTDAKRAAQLAQQAADQFVAWLDEQQKGHDDTAITAVVVDAAATPSSPSSPSTGLWLILGGVIAFLLGLLLATVRQLADRSIRAPAELEEVSGAPVLGAIAFDRAARNTPLITSLGTHHPRFEAIRILRTNLQFLDIDRDNKVITVTSSLAGEGKSTTVCNLAIALAQAGTQVVLLEGDLRRPRISEYLGVEKSVGLTTVLVGRVALEAALQPAGTPGLDVLTSGSLPPNPSEILQTNAMKGLISELRHRYDVVLIDAPPLLPVTDAALLASISDGAILVVRHGDTGREQVRTASERLTSVGARLLGTVLSMTPAKELKRYGYGYGYGYGPEYFSRTTATRTRRGARRE